MSHKAAIRDKAFALGFDACGFASAEGRADDAANLARFIEQGRHGDMAWMAETQARRADPQTLWPQARTVVVLGLNYGPGSDPLAVHAQADRGAVSVYAQGKDYHDLVKKRLKALARWMVEQFNGCDVKVFVDTAPVMEKPLAARAGLGWQGKHTNLVSKDYGSWLFLGEVFTTLTLPPDTAEPDHCGSCTACLDACPTGALDTPYRIDGSKCVSYLTIEAKGTLPNDLRERLGNRIYGCDDCLSVCPWNKYAMPTREPAFLPRAELAKPRLADLCALDDAAFREIYAGAPMKRTGRDRMVRNALIAIGNSGKTSLRGAVERLSDDESDVVRDAAAWALNRLQT